jgi:uncharacterized membrane protein
MRPPVRKLVLTVHVTVSVGWIGAVIGFLILSVAGFTSRDAETVRAAYLAMDITGWYAIVPLAFLSLLTGVASSIGTEWGLLKYYWVVLKLVLTVFATAALLVHMQVSVRVARAAATGALAPGALPGDRVQLIAAAGAGLGVLMVIMVLSMYKPRGRTRYGLRKHVDKQLRPTELPAGPDRLRSE